MTQVFICHSKRDEDIRQFFDTIFAGSKLKSVRVEFEDYTVTPSAYITEQMTLSDALFVLLGPNLFFSEYTENWVAFEIGLAAGMSQKDIWVFEPQGANVKFPVPFLHHYFIYKLNDRRSMDYIKSILAEYEKMTPRKRSLPEGTGILTCPHSDCEAVFRLHGEVQEISCPTCRRTMDVVLEDRPSRPP